MDDKLRTDLLRVLVAALLVGLVAWWRLRAAATARRKRLVELGATFHEGGSGLEVPCAQSLISAPVSPKWSASLDRDGQRFGVFPLKNGFLVITWRSAAVLPLRFVMRAAPDVGPARHRDLLPVDIDGAFTYGAPPGEVEAFLKGRAAGLFACFRSNTPGEGWEFQFHQGACYLTRYLVPADLDGVLALARSLEASLVAAQRA